ncbi:MAG: AAA family ATPase [Actinomycetota bacterium]
MLIDELGIEPSPELQELQRRVLEQDPALARGAPRPEGRAEPPLLGRLTDVGLYPIVGRAAELTQVGAALQQALAGECRLVMVGGEPGIGKTRLCREVAVHAHRHGLKVFHGTPKCGSRSSRAN